MREKDLKLPTLKELKTLKPRKRWTHTENPVYADNYDRMKCASFILNDDRQAQVDLNPYAGLDSGARSCPENRRFTLTRWEGMQEGAGDQSNEWYWRDSGQNMYRLSFLAVALQDLGDLVEDWVVHKKQQERMGYEPSDRIPEPLFSRLSERFAHFDILLVERDRLRKLVAVDEERQRQNSPVPHKPRVKPFSRGCKGKNTRKQDGLLVEIDYARVRYDGDTPIIAEGKYKGMQVVDYRQHIVPEYTKDNPMPDWPDGVEKI